TDERDPPRSPGRIGPQTRHGHKDAHAPVGPAREPRCLLSACPTVSGGRSASERDGGASIASVLLPSPHSPLKPIILSPAVRTVQRPWTIWPSRVAATATRGIEFARVILKRDGAFLSSTHAGRSGNATSSGAKTT